MTLFANARSNNLCARLFRIAWHELRRIAQTPLAAYMSPARSPSQESPRTRFHRHGPRAPRVPGRALGSCSMPKPRKRTRAPRAPDRALGPYRARPASAAPRSAHVVPFHHRPAFSYRRLDACGDDRKPQAQTTHKNERRDRRQRCLGRCFAPHKGHDLDRCWSGHAATDETEPEHLRQFALEQARQRVGIGCGGNGNEEHEGRSRLSDNRDKIGARLAGSTDEPPQRPRTCRRTAAQPRTRRTEPSRETAPAAMPSSTV
jgi:hypothetical protein